MKGDFAVSPEIIKNSVAPEQAEVIDLNKGFVFFNDFPVEIIKNFHTILS